MQKYSTIEYVKRIHWAGIINGPAGSKIAMCTYCGPIFASLQEDGKDKKACYEEALEVARAHTDDHQGVWHD